MYLDTKIKEECYGCKACADICPQKAIMLEKDTEKFQYPNIQKELCVNCNLCKEVCPINFDTFSNENETKAYVGTYNNEEVVFNSASGGAFTAIYENLINNGFLVYGVRFDDNLKVIHSCADNVAQCEDFRKSKYVLSDTNNCFVTISKQLKSDKKILFTGTPCQCAALINFLKIKRIDTSNLITVDLICHGAPNQDLFDSYINEKEAKENCKVLKYNFREKECINNNYNSRKAKVQFTNGKTEIIESDSFLKAYYSRLFYRPSCKTCKFAQPKRVADLTIGDAWGIEKIFPEQNPLKGVSLLLANSYKGLKLLSEFSDKMEIIEVSYKWAVEANAQLNSPTEFHKNRDKFFKYLRKHKDFSKSVNKALYVPYYRRVLSKGKKLLKIIFKKI